MMRHSLPLWHELQDFAKAETKRCKARSARSARSANAGNSRDGNSLNSPAAGGTSGGTSGASGGGTASINAFDLFDIDAIMHQTGGLDLGEIGCDELVSLQARSYTMTMTYTIELY
jgi:hypothetical protein